MSDDKDEIKDIFRKAPTPAPEPKTCVFCGQPFAEGAARWFVRGDAAWAPERGFAHTECMPWERVSAPWTHMLTQLPKELNGLRARLRAGERLLRAIRKLHGEWPREARRRVLLVQAMLEEWQSRR